MEVHGAALWAYFVDGRIDAEQIVRTEEGRAVTVPIRAFFRTEFSDPENVALNHCGGRVLDAGAGAGPHTLVLQARGLEVTAIDVNPQAVEIMRRRGVRDARCADILTHETEDRYDTILMLGHGIGLTGTLAGLDRFLNHCHALVGPNGQILAHSLDVRVTTDPENLAYQQSLVRQGRYRGETRIRVEFDHHIGPYCDWLHVDSETLAAYASDNGWTCEILASEPDGNYLALLRPERLNRIHPRHLA
jgi:SAM-dependent methyltransferase